MADALTVNVWSLDANCLFCCLVMRAHKSRSYQASTPANVKHGGRQSARAISSPVDAAEVTRACGGALVKVRAALMYYIILQGQNLSVV